MKTKIPTKYVWSLIVLISIIVFSIPSVSAQNPCPCSGEITDVSHVISEDTPPDIKITVKFKNTGTSPCGYKLKLYSEWDLTTEISTVPRIGHDMLWPYEEWYEEGIEVFDSGGLFSGWNALDLGRKYTVKLFDQCGNEVTSVTRSMYASICDRFLGVNCLKYGQDVVDANAQPVYTCKKDIQPNPEGYCLVKCELKDGGARCGCSPLHGCAKGCEKSVTGEAHCAFEKDFVCDGDYSCQDGTTPTVSCTTVEECKIRCAEACGRHSACGDKCEDCCIGDMCSKNNYGPKEVRACTRACQGACETRKSVCDIEGILTNIVIWLAVGMFAFNAFKMLVSADPDGRRKAKHGILYVLIGLALFMVAIPLATYLYGGEDFECYQFVPSKKCSSYKFLHIKLDPGEEEIWEFYGTDDRCNDAMNLGTTVYRISGIPGVTYECGILLTDEEDFGYDKKYMVWVDEGGLIKKEGSSLESDLSGKYATYCCDEEPCCGCGYNKNCRLSEEMAAAIEKRLTGICTGKCQWIGTTTNYCDNSLVVGGGMFGKSYSPHNSPESGQKCGNCELAEGLKGKKVYRPAYDIICSETDGKWHVCDSENCTVTAGGNDYRCENGEWKPT